MHRLLYIASSSTERTQDGPACETTLSYTSCCWVGGEWPHKEEHRKWLKWRTVVSSIAQTWTSGWTCVGSMRSTRRGASSWTLWTASVGHMGCGPSVVYRLSSHCYLFHCFVFKVYMGHFNIALIHACFFFLFFCYKLSWYSMYFEKSRIIQLKRMHTSDSTNLRSVTI